MIILLNDQKSVILKRATIFVSSIIMMLGVLLLCSGLWFLIGRAFSSQVLGNELYIIAAIMMAAVGIAVLILCGLCIWGCLFEYRWVLLGTTILFVLGAIISVIAAILAIIFPATFTDMASSAMATTLKNNYGAYPIITDAWDALQAKLRCCGVDDAGWLIYRQSQWIQIENRYPNVSGAAITFSEIDPHYKYVPATCCIKFNDPFWFYHTLWGQYRDLNRCQTWKLGPPAQQLGGYNDALYYQGCVSAAAKYFNRHIIVIIVMSLVMAVILVIEAILNVVMMIRTFVAVSHGEPYEGQPMDPSKEAMLTGSGGPLPPYQPGIDVPLQPYMGSQGAAPGSQSPQSFAYAPGVAPSYAPAQSYSPAPPTDGQQYGQPRVPPPPIKFAAMPAPGMGLNG